MATSSEVRRRVMGDCSSPGTHDANRKYLNGPAEEIGDQVETTGQVNPLDDDAGGLKGACIAEVRRTGSPPRACFAAT